MFAEARTLSWPSATAGAINHDAFMAKTSLARVTIQGYLCENQEPLSRSTLLCTDRSNCPISLPCAEASTCIALFSQKKESKHKASSFKMFSSVRCSVQRSCRQSQGVVNEVSGQLRHGSTTVKPEDYCNTPDVVQGSSFDLL